MDDKLPDEESRPASELGAAEAFSSGDLSAPASGTSDTKNPQPSHPEAVVCPSCGRSVEPGFKFCDECGTPLGDTRTRGGPAPPPSVKQDELSFPLPQAGRREGASEEKVSLIERWRRRRAQRSELGEAERALGRGPERLPSKSDVLDAPIAPKRASEDAFRRPPTAEELRGARPAIGGRLRWSEDTEVAAADQPAKTELEPLPPVIEPVGRPVTERKIEKESRSSRLPEPARLALHLVISFVCGALLLGTAAAVTTVATDGRTALLEVRGLPIFLGGATSILVFALLRTSRRRLPADGADRRAAIGSIVGGLAVLVVAAALLYQPSVAAPMQPRIERVLGVFSAADEEAVTGFQQDIREWNEESERYQAMLRTSLGDGVDFDRFRSRSEEAENSLVDIVEQMRAHAGVAEHPELRDALGDLSSVYDDQLGGLRLVNRGLLIDGIDLVRTGDAHYKDAVNRAQTLFERRLRPLLERAGLDARAFGQAVRA